MAEALKTTSHNDWENERIYAINKEEGRATFIPFANSEEMKADCPFSGIRGDAGKCTPHGKVRRQYAAV